MVRGGFGHVKSEVTVNIAKSPEVRELEVLLTSRRNCCPGGLGKGRLKERVQRTTAVFTCPEFPNI